MPPYRNTQSNSSTSTKLDGDVLHEVLGMIKELAGIIREHVTHGDNPKRGRLEMAMMLMSGFVGWDRWCSWVPLIS